MVEYKLKYEGEKIDELLEAVDDGSVVASNTVSVIESGNGKPVSSDAIHRALDNKVDKIAGQGLSEWSYTSEDRDAVATVKDGSIITDNTVSSLIIDEVKPISSGAIQKLWEDKGYTFEGVRINGSGEYDVYIGGTGGPRYIVSSNAKVEIPLDGTSVTFKGEATITASISRYQDESTGSYRGTLNVRVTGGLPLYNTFFVESITPMLDALIPYTVLRKDDVLDNISAGSTLPVQSHVITMALSGKVDKVEGMGLSTNDYTNEEKAQVAKIKGKQEILTLTVKNNGNIVLGNIAGQTKEFMPATPSGDPMHYKYLKVYGLTYDEITGLWSYRASEGGLTDLTTDEVANMYIVGGSPSVQDNAWCRWANYIANRYPARMNIFPIYYQYTQGLTSFMNYSLAFSENTKIKVAVVTAQPSLVCQPKECVGMFRKAQNLERVIGIIDLSQATVTGAYNIHMFGLCYALRDLNIVKLKASIHFGESPLLSKQALLGLIQNAIPTSAITITLHAEAYARLANDADILAALAAQPNISLISA